MNLSDSQAAISLASTRRMTATSSVVEALRHDIGTGVVAVGARLPSEMTLAQLHSVSRPIVREALRSLAALGLTETRNGLGTFVIADRVGGELKLGRYGAHELAEARPHVEVPSATLAATRRSLEDAALLQDLVDRMTSETAPAPWAQLDAQFHAAIARASGNRVFESVVVDIRDAMAKQSETIGVVADRRKQSLVEHQLILDAILVGDADAARDAMTIHLDAVARALRDLDSRENHDH